MGVLARKLRHGIYEGMSPSIKILFMVALTGCSSLHSKVYDEVSIGTPKTEILAKFGRPQAFQALPGDSHVVLGYQKKADFCQFEIENEAVKTLQCQTDPAYRARAHGIVSSIFNGMSQPSQTQSLKDKAAPINCSTQVNSFTNSAFTSCY